MNSLERVQGLILITLIFITIVQIILSYSRGMIELMTANISILFLSMGYLLEVFAE